MTDAMRDWVDQGDAVGHAFARCIHFGRDRALCARALADPVRAAEWDAYVAATEKRRDDRRPRYLEAGPMRPTAKDRRRKREWMPRKLRKDRAVRAAIRLDIALALQLQRIGYGGRAMLAHRPIMASRQTREEGDG